MSYQLLAHFVQLHYLLLFLFLKSCRYILLVICNQCGNVNNITVCITLGASVCYEII